MNEVNHPSDNTQDQSKLNSEESPQIESAEIITPQDAKNPTPVQALNINTSPTTSSLSPIGVQNGTPTVDIQQAHLPIQAMQFSGGEHAGPILSDSEADRQINRMTRRSLLWGTGAVLGSYGLWSWINTRRLDNGVLWPLRRVLELNEQIALDIQDNKRLAPEFAQTAAIEPQINPADGGYGVNSDLDMESWKLRLLGLEDMKAAVMPDASTFSDTGNAPEPAVELTMKDILAFKKYEMITELKCIEGWSAIVHWSGARLADLIAKYPPMRVNSDDAHPPRVSYVSLETPDGAYYVSIDMLSAMHPQTLLCYEMNGKPLPALHGAPLRLVIPIKYGIKNIKQIGTIRFSEVRPNDYWGERGYDWYAGH